MDFALAHNVRGVTLTRREREKGLNHRTVKSSQRQDTHTDREGGEGEEGGDRLTLNPVTGARPGRLSL